VSAPARGWGQLLQGSRRLGLCRQDVEEEKSIGESMANTTSCIGTGKRCTGQMQMVWQLTEQGMLTRRVSWCTPACLGACLQHMLLLHCNVPWPRAGQDPCRVKPHVGHHASPLPPSLTAYILCIRAAACCCRCRVGRKLLIPLPRRVCRPIKQPASASSP
jgi:hypothetical protein